MTMRGANLICRHLGHKPVRRLAGATPFSSLSRISATASGAKSRVLIYVGARHVHGSRAVRYSSTATDNRQRNHTGTLKTLEDIDRFLAQPSWSVWELLADETKEQQASSPAQFNETRPSEAPQITRDTLHHLLRLSALPLPKSDQEEASLMQSLRRQLHFVRAIADSPSLQSSLGEKISASDVEPLVAIRDETAACREERVADLNSPAIRDVLFDGEEKAVGKRGRIVSVNDDKHRGTTTAESRLDEDGGARWSPLKQAGRTAGRFIVVNTKHD